MLEQLLIIVHHHIYKYLFILFIMDKSNLSKTGKTLMLVSLIFFIGYVLLMSFGNLPESWNRGGFILLGSYAGGIFFGSIFFIGLILWLIPRFIKS